MSHSAHVMRSRQVLASVGGLSEQLLPWAVAILFSLLWGLLVGLAWAGEPAAGPSGKNGNGLEALSLWPVAAVYTQTEGRPLVQPAGISLDPETGEILVTDGTAGLVTMYTSDGIPTAALGYNGELTEPVRAVTTGGGRIYVLNAIPRAIRMFSSRGEYIGDLEFRGLGAGERVYPTAIAADAEGNLFLGDSRKDTARVLVFDRSGNLRLQFGSLGTGKGEFQIIVGIAADRDGRIYVLEGSRRERVVQIFDREGKFIRGWGQREGGPTNFSQPVGIAVSQSNYVVVADGLRQTLQIYTPDGTFLGRFGGMGVLPGNLTFPSDVATDGNGRLYVAERVGRRFQILEMTRRTAPANAGLRVPAGEDQQERIRAEVGAFSEAVRRGRR